MAGNEIVEGITRQKGAYILQIRLNDDLTVQIPSLDNPKILAGIYLYCGSANGPGGINARVQRHLKRDKKAHWHVDHLTIACGVEAFCTFEGGAECDLVDTLIQSGVGELPYVGFGSSDCERCWSHLVCLKDEISLAQCFCEQKVFLPAHGRVF